MPERPVRPFAALWRFLSPLQGAGSGVSSWVVAWIGSTRTHHEDVAANREPSVEGTLIYTKPWGSREGASPASEAGKGAPIGLDALLQAAEPTANGGRKQQRSGQQVDFITQPRTILGAA